MHLAHRCPPIPSRRGSTDVTSEHETAGRQPSAQQGAQELHSTLAKEVTCLEEPRRARRFPACPKADTELPAQPHSPAHTQPSSVNEETWTWTSWTTHRSITWSCRILQKTWEDLASGAQMALQRGSNSIWGYLLSSTYLFPLSLPQHLDVYFLSTGLKQQKQTFYSEINQHLQTLLPENLPNFAVRLPTLLAFSNLPRELVLVLGQLLDLNQFPMAGSWRSSGRLGSSYR